MASYKFRVLLDNSNKEQIFRDIVINENDNFESLYKCILNSFSFKGDQMASFYLSNENWDKGHEISLMDINYGDENQDELSSIMSNTIIKTKLQDTKYVILVHDFMRMWIFLIELIEKSNDQIENPKTVLSVGIAPPEDSKSSDFILESEDNFNGNENILDEFDDEFDEEFIDEYDEEDYNSFEEEY